jgi:hypothetical protein
MLTVCLLAASIVSTAVSTQESAPPAILGRWDLTIHTARGDRPAWLEVRHSGLRTLIGQFVGTGGSARPISQIDFKDNELHFAIPPQWERADGNLVVTGRLDGERLSGTMTLAGGQPEKWDGVRAPSLRRTEEPKWSTPMRLLKANDLSGWHAIGANEWEVEGGVLKNKKSGGNLVTDQTFTSSCIWSSAIPPAATAACTFAAATRCRSPISHRQNRNRAFWERCMASCRRPRTSRVRPGSGSRSILRWSAAW